MLYVKGNCFFACMQKMLVFLKEKYVHDYLETYEMKGLLESLHRII